MAKAKKPRFFWFRNKKVVASRKNYEQLKKDKKSHVAEISSIIEEFNSFASDVVNAEDWMDRLPLQTMDEMRRFEDGEQMMYNLQALNQRQKLRKEHDKKVDALQILECKVNESKVDFLLSKVKCMAEKM